MPLQASKPIVVATHNLMHGLRTEVLIPHYLELRKRQGLDLLVLQEDRMQTNGELPSTRIGAALGSCYQIVRDDGCPGLCLVYDARTLSCETRSVVPLPRLASLNWFEKLYIVGGKTSQKYVLLAEMRARQPDGLFAAVCFHLDTAGGNEHRLTQVHAIAKALVAGNLQGRFVGCGDTNAFAWRRQPAALRRLLAPLAALGAVDTEIAETRPTHYFARQHEPKLLHKTGVLLGKLGLDLPLRYDVVCTNLNVADRGQVVTPDSDHDLVWARLDLGPESPSQRRGGSLVQFL